MSGRYDRQNKILEAVRQLIKNGWSKMEINDSLYNIGINQKDVINALDNRKRIVGSRAYPGRRGTIVTMKGKFKFSWC